MADVYGAILSLMTDISPSFLDEQIDILEKYRIRDQRIPYRDIRHLHCQCLLIDNIHDNRIGCV